MKIDSKLCPTFVPHHKKYTCVPATNTGLYFLWLRTNIGQSLELIFMWFIARASKASGFQGYLLTFFDFYSGTSKTHMNWQQGLRKSLGIRNMQF